MATTVGDLITAAFRKVGIYVPTTAQTASALISLNNMIGSWGIEQLRPSVTRESFTVSSGTASYTMGPSGTWNTVRPIKIENAFLRDSAGYDTPLDIISAKDYNDISYKSTSATPSAIYFVPEETQAKVFFDYTPDTAYTIYLESWKSITEFASTSESIALPNEYKEAIIYNLAISLAEDWDRVVSQSVHMKARETKDLISVSNAATRPVPKAKFDFSDRLPFNITTG